MLTILAILLLQNLGGVEPNQLYLQQTTAQINPVVRKLQEVPDGKNCLIKVVLGSDHEQCFVEAGKHPIVGAPFAALLFKTGLINPVTTEFASGMLYATEMLEPGLTNQINREWK